MAWIGGLWWWQKVRTEEERGQEGDKFTPTLLLSPYHLKALTLSGSSRKQVMWDDWMWTLNSIVSWKKRDRLPHLCVHMYWNTDIFQINNLELLLSSINWEAPHMFKTRLNGRLLLGYLNENLCVINETSNAYVTSIHSSFNKHWFQPIPLTMQP